MKTADHQKVIEIFNDALELPADERARFLDSVCGADGELRAEVESLIASDDDAFLEEDVSRSVLELIRGGLLPGDVVCDRYEIVELIGQGGMGEVYLARDSSMKRLVAVKILAEHFSQDQRRVKNFRNEAHTVSQINHQNILTVYDFDREGGTSFIVTEYIEGETLRSRLQAGPLDVPTALAIARQIASALEAAHVRGVIHRDIKPENVIVRRDGHVKVLDFGIAKLAEREAPEDKSQSTGMSQAEGASGFGTANYMSCEQVRAQGVDARTDIWSLGICLYEMLTGAQPFKGETRIDAFASILKDEPAPLGGQIPESLKAIVKKALRKNRDHRYQTMREFRADLERSPAAPSSGAHTFMEWRKTSGARIWAILLALAVSSCLISLALAFIIYFSGSVHPDPLERVKSAAQWAQGVGSGFHLIVILIAFWYLRKNPGPRVFRSLKYDKAEGRLKSGITYSTGYEKVPDWRRARKIAIEALKIYRGFFVWLLFAWLFLYSWVLVSLFDFKEGSFLVTSVFTLANNLNTLCIWLCFHILNEPITTGKGTQNKKGIIVIEGLKWPAGFIPATFSVVLWLILELFLTYKSAPPADVIHYISRVISGIAGGVAMALFVARFQSKFLKSPSWLVFILFLYTVIQALFIFYGGQTAAEEGGAAIVMNAALVLKCLLILYMFWLFQSGRLLFYLVRVRRATTQIDSEWQNFREVLQQEN